MVGDVLQSFMPRPWGFAGSGFVSPGVGLGLGSPPVHGVVGGLEGLSLVCESPRVSSRRTGSFGSVGGGGGGGGTGARSWSAEGGRQLETWRVRWTSRCGGIRVRNFPRRESETPRVLEGFSACFRLKPLILFLSTWAVLTR